MSASQAGPAPGDPGSSPTPHRMTDVHGPEPSDQERRNALSLLEAALDATHDGLLVVDTDGDVVTYNERFQELWGIPDDLVRTGDDEALLAYVVDQLADPDAFLERVAEIYDDPEAVTFDELPFEDGRIMERRSRPQYLDGEVVGRVWSFREITDEVEAKRELERSNEELQQFAYIISHDLQEPLRMIRSYVDLLERRYADTFDEDAQDFMGFVTDGVTRAQAMVKGVLAFSRVETHGDPFEPVDIQAVLKGVLDDLQVAIEEAGAQVTADPLPTVMADPTQVGRLLQNLIGNAIRFRSPDREPRIHVSADQQGYAWRFTVADNGVGIDPNQQERAFQLFQQLSPREGREGIGLGLALCKRIVERHGGRIGVDATSGEGSTFWFTLPGANA